MPRKKQENYWQNVKDEIGRHKEEEFYVTSEEDEGAEGIVSHVPRKVGARLIVEKVAHRSTEEEIARHLKGQHELAIANAKKQKEILLAANPFALLHATESGEFKEGLKDKGQMKKPETVKGAL